MRRLQCLPRPACLATLVALAALAVPAPAQLGNVDQHCLAGVNGVTSGTGKGWIVQQQVRAGRTGLLTGAEVWLAGLPGHQAAVRVRRGAVPSTEPVLWEQVVTLTGGSTPDVPLLDTSAAGILLAEGETFALEVELLDIEVHILGVVGSPLPCYPEPTFPVAPANPTLRWLFRTFMDEPAPGQAYCVPSVSFKGPVHMWAKGSTSVAANDLEFVSGPVPDMTALFYYGTQTTQLPFGTGFVCVGGVLGRLPASFPQCGTLVTHFDLTQLPPQIAVPGQTLYAQGWFRQLFTFGFSEAYAITLTP